MWPCSRLLWPRSTAASLPPANQVSCIRTIRRTPISSQIWGKVRLIVRKIRYFFSCQCIYYFCSARWSERFFFPLLHRYFTGLACLSFVCLQHPSAVLSEGCGLGLLPTCTRPWPASPARFSPPRDALLRSPRGRTPAALPRRDSSLLQNFPP